MRKKIEQKNAINKRIKTKDNGDLYQYDPIKGYNVPLYENEYADIPIFENHRYDQRIVDTLEEKINNNPR